MCVMSSRGSCSGRKKKKTRGEVDNCDSHQTATTCQQVISAPSARLQSPRPSSSSRVAIILSLIAVIIRWELTPPCQRPRYLLESGGSAHSRVEGRPSERLQISRRHEVEFGGNGEEESQGWRRRSSFTCRSLFKLEPSVMRFFFFFFLITGGVKIADAERPRWVSSTARSTASQKRTSLGLFLGQTPGRTQNLQEGLHISSGSGISCWDPPGRTEGSSWGDGRLDCSASPAW